MQVAYSALLLLAPHTTAHPTLRMLFGVSVYMSAASVLPVDMVVRLSSDGREAH